MTVRSKQFSMTVDQEGILILTPNYIPVHLKSMDEKETFLIQRFKEWRDAVLSEGHYPSSLDCNVWKTVRESLLTVPVSTEGSHQPGAVPGTGKLSHLNRKSEKGNR